MSDELCLIANRKIWLIQTRKFNVLHSNMLFLCMLHIKSTVSCFILEVTNYEPLVYHILLVCYAQSALIMHLLLKTDATVSIFMIILYTYLVLIDP